MINELYDLAKTLEQNKIEIEKSHEMYLPLIVKKCIRIWLSEEGEVCGIEQLSKETTATLKTYGNDHNRFPAFNINQLYRITDEHIINELNSIANGFGPIDIKKLQSWCLEDNWIKDSAKKVVRSLQETSQKLISVLGGDFTSTENVIFKAAQLSNLFFAENSPGFRKAIEQYIFKTLEKGEDRKLLLHILFYQGNSDKKHENDRGENIMVIVDVQQWEKYHYSVANTNTTAWINQRLLETSTDQTKNPHLKKEKLDAFGESMGSTKGAMPLVIINGKQISLRTMFKDHYCQTRYTKIGDNSYPIAADNRRTIAGAVDWIASPERKGVTWDIVGDNEVLFVYPTRLPDIPIKFTSIFGPSSQTPDQQARFESLAKQFLKATKGQALQTNPEYIHIFIYKKTDKNGTSKRGKIIFTHNTTPERLIQAANDWSYGCHNLPKLDVGITVTPFPLGVADVINSVWKQNGERADHKTQVKRMKYYQGIELLLDALPQSAVRNFLHIAIEHSSGLINHLGSQLHSGGKFGIKTETGRLEKKRNAAAQVLSVLGLLLYKCEKRKENYMEELAYLLGQLLHVSDELHTLYCKCKRDNEIPPQLAGGALFVSAGVMPYQALSQLSVRMQPYIAWAKQYRFEEIIAEGKESWRAKWLLRLYEKLSDKLHPRMDKTIRFGDYERAQLFIGYMASLSQKEPSGTSTDTNENIISGGMDNE